MIRIAPASTVETTAVMKIVRLSAGACVAALALALSGGMVSAQQKAPEAKKVEAAKKAEPAKKEAAKKAAPAKKKAAVAKKKPAPAKKKAAPAKKDS